MLDAILTSKPYPVRGMYISSMNIAVMYPDTRRTLTALKSLDFICVASQTMTPTAAVADIVLPKTTTLEEEEVDISQSGGCVAYTHPASTRVGEVRCDLGDRGRSSYECMRARGAVTAELLPWKTQKDFNQFMIGAAKIDQEALHRDGFVEFPRTFGDFAKQAIKTPSGKFELYSNTLEKLGLDPLPDHVVPLYERTATEVQRQNSRSFCRPANARRHTTTRVSGKQAWARKVSPDPTIRIHPETAKSIRNRRSVSWIFGRDQGRYRRPCRLLAEMTDRTAPDVITTGIGWWRPEASGLRNSQHSTSTSTRL